MTVLNLETVCSILHDKGVRAYVEQTGGGCATIYAGTQHPYPERGETWPAWDAAAGPGWFEQQPTRTADGLHFEGWFAEGRADTSDFSVGPDDMGEGPYVMATDEWTEQTVADEMLKLITLLSLPDHLTLHHGGQFELDADAPVVLDQITEESLKHMHGVLHREMPQDHDESETTF
jgi:hypothetical protein